MRALVFLVFLEIHSVAAVTHSLQYFYTGSTGLERFPRFVAVGVVDGEQIDYYDSVSEKNVLKQTWMEGVRDESGITETRRGHQQTFQANVAIAMQRFNQTTGVHIVQWMYGCEWNDETNELNGFYQHGYDGEDFISLDLNTQTWIAPKQEAVITKNKWDSDRAKAAQRKNYLTQICPEWIKKYLDYGRSSLMRTVLPSVSLLQKSSSSPITCLATGFHPNRAEMVWKKNGEELHEGVHKGEILPNNDGTFQMSVKLDLSAVGSEDWDRYSCVFQLSGVNQDITTRLEKAGIRSNEGGSLSMIIPVVVAVVVLAAVAVIGFIIYKKRADKRPPSPVVNPEVQEQMLPKA